MTIFVSFSRGRIFGIFYDTFTLTNNCGMFLFCNFRFKLMKNLWSEDAVTLIKLACNEISAKIIIIYKIGETGEGLT